MEVAKKMYNIIRTLISLLINRLDFFFLEQFCVYRNIEHLV